MPEMTKRDRLEATIHGAAPDRVPAALWRHFPGDDQDPRELATSTVAFQRQFDFDFVKVTPASSYCVRDWGVRDAWLGNEEGTRVYTEHPIHRPEDWQRLRLLDPEQGHLAGALGAVKLIRSELQDTVPLVQTVFNPLSQAKNLAGRETLLSHLREDPGKLLAGLEIITETTVRFVKAAIQAGVAGIFLAVQHASFELLSEEEYSRFGIPFDLQILGAAEGLWLNVLHLHGRDVMFDLLADYPVHVVNWHDRESKPTLADGQAKVGGAVLGGLQQWETMLRGRPLEVEREAREAMDQTRRRRFILGTGCVTPITAPWANLRAARKAVEFS